MDKFKVFHWILFRDLNRNWRLLTFPDLFRLLAFDVFNSSSGSSSSSSSSLAPSSSLWVAMTTSLNWRVITELICHFHSPIQLEQHDNAIFDGEENQRRLHHISPKADIQSHPQKGPVLQDHCSHDTPHLGIWPERLPRRHFDLFLDHLSD